MERGEVNFFRPGQAKIQNAYPFITQAVGERSFKSRGGGADIATQNDTLGLEELCERAGNTIGDIFIELCAELAADIVGFEAGEA